MAGKLQNADHKTLAELTGAGGVMAELLNDSKIYLTGSAKQLSQAILDGDFSGGSGINYITAKNADSGIGAWIVSKNTVAAATPDSGFVTSGTSNTFVTSGTTPLRGTLSFLYTLAALGNQAYIPFTIDNADKGRPLRGSIDYEIASGSYSDGSIVAWIFDVTNSVFIPCTPGNILNSGLKEVFNFEFQAASNSTSYRLLLHQAIASTAALRLDNFSLGPTPKFFGANIIDLGTETWVDSEANCTTSVQLARVGNRVFVSGICSVTGAFTGSTFDITLPSAYTAKSTELEAFVGFAHLKDTGTNDYNGIGYLNTSSQLRIFVEAVGGTYGIINNIASNVPFIWANTDKIFFQASWIVDAWQSTAIMSNDADTRSVSALYNGQPTGTINGSTDNKYPTKQDDSHSAYNVSTGVYTVPVNGKYDISVAGFISITTGSFTSVVILKNGATTLAANQLPFPTNFTNSISTFCQVNGVSLKAGDTITVRFNGNGTPVFNSTAEYSWFSISKVGGPSQIQASESIDVRAINSAGTSIANSGDIIVPFATESWDNQSSWVTDTFTAPAAGKYQVKAQVWFASATYATGNRVYIGIQKNGAVYSYGERNVVFAIFTDTFTCEVLDEVQLLVGETIKIFVSNNRTAGATNLDSANSVNYVNIRKVGNY